MFVTGDTPDPYGSGPATPGFFTKGVDAPENLYYRRVFTDAARAVDAVRSLPGVRADRVATWGHSQGGALALAAAALVPDVAACAARTPFLCGIDRSAAISPEGPYLEVATYQSVHRDSGPRALEVLSYIDCALLAPWIRCPTWICVALMDTVCPPSGIYGAINNMTVDPGRGGATVQRPRGRGRLRRGRPRPLVRRAAPRRLSGRSPRPALRPPDDKDCDDHPDRRPPGTHGRGLHQRDRGRPLRRHDQPAGSDQPPGGGPGGPRRHRGAQPERPAGVHRRHHHRPVVSRRPAGPVLRDGGGVRLAAGPGAAHHRDRGLADPHRHRLPAGRLRRSGADRRHQPGATATGR